MAAGTWSEAEKKHLRNTQKSSQSKTQYFSLIIETIGFLFRVVTSQ